MAQVIDRDRTFVVCNVNGSFYALDGICPHRGAPLAHGALHDNIIVCPWHAWEFDCRSGQGDCADIPTIPVTVEQDVIYLHAGTS